MSEEQAVMIEEWDGHPRHGFTMPELHAIYAFVPQWHGMAEGPPIPFTGGVHARVAVDSIFTATRDEAEQVLWAHIRAACERERMQFDSDDWRVLHLILLGGS